MVGDETFIKLLKGYNIATSPNVIEESFYKSLYLKKLKIYMVKAVNICSKKNIQRKGNITKKFTNILVNL